MVINGQKWLDISFLGIFYHLYLLKGNPMIQPLPLFPKLLSLGAVAMISMEREQLQAITTPFSPICLKMEFLVIFRHFSLLVPAHGLIPPQLLLTKNIITGYYCNDIYEERPALGHGKH